MIIAGTILAIACSIVLGHVIKEGIKEAFHRGYTLGYKHGQQKTAFDMALLQTEIDGKRDLPPTLR